MRAWCALSHDLPSFAKMINNEQATNPTQAAMCESEFRAWQGCMLLNTAICSTATCSAALGDLNSIDAGSTSCADDAVKESCDAFTCCAACSDLGMAVVNCAASADGCPQRCGPSGARASSSGATAALAGGILAAMAILGSVFFA
jgi:hypothetical protein